MRHGVGRSVDTGEDASRLDDEHVVGDTVGELNVLDLI
jgi:hypothetical protein